MIRYPNEGRTKGQVTVFDTFTSVDLSRASAELKSAHSPDALNMIRDAYGKVRRRMGYFALPLTDLPETGSRAIRALEWFGVWIFVHMGNRLMRRNSNGKLVDLGLEMQDFPTQFFHGEHRMHVLSKHGMHMISAAGEVWGSDIYVPTVMVAGEPSGAGQPFEQVNLMNDFWVQSYRGDGQSTVYQLAFGDIGDRTVFAKVYEIQGSQTIEHTYSDLMGNLTVDRVLGQVTFPTPPGKPGLGQEDNVFITGNKDRTEQRARVLNCRVGRPFGINGYENQWFLSGNPALPGYLFWSAQNDPTYFGDMQYAILGQNNSGIISLSAMGDRLAVHKDQASGMTYLLSLFLAEINGLMTPQVRVDRVVRGEGCVGRYASQHFGEPIFLTPLGLQALTYRDLTNTEIETVRSERINGQLLAQRGLLEARSCIYRNYYLLTGDEGRVFVLDRLNPQGDSGALNNAHQYNAFIWDDIPASCFLVRGDRLIFGTADGRLMEFYRDPEDPESYQDDGRSYSWRWTLPEQLGELFYREKRLCHLAVRGKSATHTAFSVDIQIDGVWYPLMEDYAGLGSLDLGRLDLSRLVLSLDRTPKFLSEKVREGHLDKFSLRIRGDALCQPFGLQSVAFEVKERGKRKR